MKKVFIAYGILVAIVIILAFVKFSGSNILPSFNKPTAKINHQVFNLKIADDDKSRQIGLSNTRSMKDDEGMLFVFPEKGRYSFWMKDTEIPLDIIYISDGKIVHIVKNAKPQQDAKGPYPIYTPPTEANHVLEINGGLSDRFKFKNGDTVVLSGVN